MVSDLNLYKCHSWVSNTIIENVHHNLFRLCRKLISSLSDNYNHINGFTHDIERYLRNLFNDAKDKIYHAFRFYFIFIRKSISYLEYSLSVTIYLCIYRKLDEIIFFLYFKFSTIHRDYPHLKIEVISLSG
jgi:hypothetical protein